MSSICVLVLASSVSQISKSPIVWSNVGVGGGGSLFAPSFNPSSPDEIFTSCDMSQWFRTTNLGASWSVLDFRRIQGSGTTSPVQFTNVPGLLYALDFSNDLARPSKSLDGGKTWARLSVEPTGGAAYAFRADPSDSNRLLIASASDLYYSSNGGTSWSSKYHDASGNLHIAGAFFDGSTIAVGTGYGLLLSNNGGSTFVMSSATGIPSTEAICSFAGAKSGITTRFYVVTLGTADVYVGVGGATVNIVRRANLLQDAVFHHRNSATQSGVSRRSSTGQRTDLRTRERARARVPIRQAAGDPHGR